VSSAATPALIALPHRSLCLGFVNTLAWRGREAPSESLTHPAAFVEWLRTSGGMPRSFARALEDWSRTNPARAVRVLADAIALRESLFRLLGAAHLGARELEADFSALQGMLEAAPPRRHLALVRGACFWRVDKLRPRAADMLAPVLWSAADLLAGDARARVRRCANGECQWLFLDESRTGMRRWCDMAACGNRAKARRHYLRSKTA